MQTQAAFAPLERVVAKYRRDVHRLSSGASPEALTALEGHLGRSLPRGLRTFLGQHNGADLFRGSLRIRSTSDIVPASEDAIKASLFADGPGDRRWAWATDPNGEMVFGVWEDGRLEPYHATFAGWLAGAIALLDTRVASEDDREALRFEADPDDVHQLLRAGHRALRRGRPDEAEGLLRRAITLRPTEPAGWQLLGEALAISDRSAARKAWLQALHHTRFPLPWPGASCIAPDTLRSLRAAFRSEEEWEKVLFHFLDDQAHDVTCAASAEVVVAAARELARSKLRRGRRSEAREVYANLLSRCRVFTYTLVPWPALVELAELEAGLGHHDEAEGLLRQLRREGPDELQGRGLLLLARIAVTRQEPWAEEILEEAVAAGLDETDGIRAATLRVERAIRNERKDEAHLWLERARTVAHRVGNKPLIALVALAEGDVARADGQRDEAWQHYTRGEKTLAKGDDPELRHRLHLRIGDLCLEEGRVRDAEYNFHSAAKGFQALELPVREGWALLRLARVSTQPAPLLTSARERFFEADLAAGLAAIDAVSGAPGASLSRHLDRATVHARARLNAQRSRPPWERADADRPERRLGAHRLAIAACGIGVVDAIQREMEACVRAMATGRGRALDPPVLRYIAAVDLLSAHRSYEASAALLGHLLSRVVEGPARRALQGAIARSPNAALVDGLLSVVENHATHPAQGVAEAAELLGFRRERAAIRPLLYLGQPDANPISRKAAIAALGRIGDRAVVDHIVPALDDALLQEQAALALLMLGDRRGVDFHGRMLSEKRRDLSGSPGEIVGRYGGPAHLLLLMNAADGEGEAAVGALHGLGLMGDPRAVPTLLGALTRRDRKAVEIAAGALQILTGHEEDIEAPGAKTGWRTWWSDNGHRFSPATRYREGRLFDAGRLIENMEHSDAWVRRTAYDELVITSGRDLPFDSDGPWRVQRSHLRAWKAWWAEAKHESSPGSWFLDGALLT